MITTKANILNVLQNIVTDKKSGTRLSGKYQEDILEAIEKILSKNDPRKNIM